MSLTEKFMSEATKVYNSTEKLVQNAAEQAQQLLAFSTLLEKARQIPGLQTLSLQLIEMSIQTPTLTRGMTHRPSFS